MVSGVVIVLVGCMTHRGQRRSINEDSYLVRELSLGHLLAVADGMGGHQAGDVASSMAMEILETFTFQHFNLQEMVEVIVKMNQVIYGKAQSHSNYYGMGTTLTLSLFIGDRILLGHVGDSRAYLLEEDDLRRLTTDHSLVTELLNLKEITEEESLHHPYRHILSQALGTEQSIEVESHEVPVSHGSILLLCTDGLTNHVSEGEIKEILTEYRPHEAVQFLVDRANELGGQDNITAVVCSFI